MIEGHLSWTIKYKNDFEKRKLNFNCPIRLFKVIKNHELKFTWDFVFFCQNTPDPKYKKTLNLSIGTIQGQIKVIQSTRSVSKKLIFGTEIYFDIPVM